MRRFRRARNEPESESGRRRTRPEPNTLFEITFEWKESVVYWEGSRGVVFPGA